MTIALTSCICKTVERMVNERLIHFLEKNNILTKFQAGFRTERSTLDQLVRLDTFIKDAFAAGDHVVAVFFDLAKAYDTTWKYGIMKDLHTMGLRGNLPIFIQNFLSDRTFHVLLGTTFSTEEFSQEEGVPQGAILSTTLFNVKLNDIVKALPEDIRSSLYVDDFKIYFRSPSIDTIERRLQLAINKIENWTLKNGFTVSPIKTKAMLFCKCGRKCRDPILTLCKQEIEIVREHKFLGLIWDQKLTFKPHMEYLKKRCAKALSLIGVLAHSNWGSDTKTLLRLFRSLVRSKLDYGCIVYMTGDAESLKGLDILHRHGLRMCLGAFKSSPIQSLYVEANEPPLELRRKELAIRYALKIKSNPNNAAYDSIYKQPYSLDSLGESIKELFKEARIDKTKIAYTKVPDTPIWQSEPNDVSFKLSAYDKSTTSQEFFRAKFLSDVLPDYNGYVHIYTDGSKNERKASFAVYCEYGYKFDRIRNDSSIFTAELEAIISALRYIEIPRNKDKKFVIFSDSKSVLESIENQVSKNPLMNNVLDKLQELSSNGWCIKFCWVPSHVGIRGNEMADRRAKSALDLIYYRYPTEYKFPYTDFIPKAKSLIRRKWQAKWAAYYVEKGCKLYDVMPVIKPFYLNSLCRKDEVVIHRIRIGHTRLTHRHLMENRPVPICSHCNLEVLSVKHLMMECQHFANIRSNHYRAVDMKDLFERIPLRHIIDFLKEAKLYHEI